MSNDVLAKVEHVRKKFCRSLGKSLRYGVQDILSDLNPFARNGDGSNGSGDDALGHHKLRKDEFWAVNDVSFELRRGECLGLIGHNGAGKTTLLKMLNGLIKPDHGRIEMRGRIGALIALGAGFNPILTGRENIYVNGSVLGLTKREIGEKIEDIIDFADISDFIDTPVQSYSSGMQVRLGFAVATTLDPDVLILDEVLAVGDTAFRGKCFARIGRMLNNAAVIFVSHSEPQVSRICSQALLMKSGIPVYYGETSEALKLYRATQEKPNTETKIVKDTRVENISVLAKSEVVTWGGYLDLKVELRISDDLFAGVILLHWSRNGEFVANSEARYSSPGALPLNAGTHVFNISVGPVQLVHGQYDLSLSIFDKTRQKTIVQAFDLTSTNVIGPVGDGPANLMPMKISTRSATDDQ